MDAFEDNPAASGDASPPPPASNGEAAGNGFEDGVVVVEEEVAAAQPTPTAFPTDAINEMEDLEDEVSGHLSTSDPILTKDPNADLSMENLKICASPVPAQEEPETIKVWREKQKQLLEEKDQKEQKMMEELKEQAKKELEDW